MNEINDFIFKLEFATNIYISKHAKKRNTMEKKEIAGIIEDASKKMVTKMAIIGKKTLEKPTMINLPSGERYETDKISVYLVKEARNQIKARVVLQKEEKGYYMQMPCNNPEQIERVAEYMRVHEITPKLTISAGTCPTGEYLYNLP